MRHIQALSDLMTIPFTIYLEKGTILHFDVTVYGYDVDPYSYYSEGEYSEEYSRAYTAEEMLVYLENGTPLPEKN